MPIEFPIGTKVISLGRVADPVIPILVRTRRGSLPFDFLIDSGADCSIIPASIAETELGPHPLRNGSHNRQGNKQPTTSVSLRREN